jgi:hypothetical protein
MKTPRLRMYLCYGLVIALCIGSTGYSFAQGLPSLKSLAGGGSGEPADINALADKQSALGKRLNAALTEIAGAQTHFAKALGNKEQADELQAVVDALAKGNTNDETLIKTSTQLETVSKEQRKRLNAINQLDANQKQEIQAGLVPYSKGTAHTVLLGKEFGEHLKAAQGAISKASVVNAAQIKDKLGLTLSLAPKLPGLGTTHAETATALIKMAKSNNLNTQEADKAMTL